LERFEKSSGIATVTTSRSPGVPERRAGVRKTPVDAPFAGIPTAEGRRPAASTMSHRLLLRFCANGS
jgi:hypothetical protein